MRPEDDACERRLRLFFPHDEKSFPGRKRPFFIFDGTENSGYFPVREEPFRPFPRPCPASENNMPFSTDIYPDIPGTTAHEGVFQAAAKVRFLVLDVDGVCTDGKLYFQENGHPMKCFNSQDGIGIKTALLAGIGVGIITGRNDPCVLARMSQLGVKDYYAGFESKLPKLEAIRRKYGLAPEEMAYLGDDWIDLDPMRSVGMPMAVANAVRQVKKEALYITAARGGEGAVREAVEFLLAARMDGKNPADLWTAATGPAKV